MLTVNLGRAQDRWAVVMWVSQYETIHLQNSSDEHNLDSSRRSKWSLMCGDFKGVLLVLSWEIKKDFDNSSDIFVSIPPLLNGILHY